ncbi:GIY-YIG nuclease family protein [Pandoraea pneumonica]|uniref:GIY-YIG nuclease family protein n=1 Tax=Pandoraea pneumonica TaxID=2508299 RepID=UPI001241CF19|nr:GIY-YIG nuclease family protein [Pandoraea pneumonica]
MQEKKFLEDAGLKHIPILRNRRGIYFLLLRERIRYVGKTEDIYQRLGQHINVKEFDDVMFVPTDLLHLQAYEEACIRIFRPELNHERTKGELQPDDDAMLRHLIGSIGHARIERRLKRFLEKRVLENAGTVHGIFE